MRIASVAAVAACLGMFFAGIGTSYAGGIDKTVKTSAIPSVSRTTGYPKPDLTLPRGSQYTILIQSYAKQYGIPADLAHAIVEVESNFNAKARGSAGEVGLMQIKPATARMMGYTGSIKDLYEHETGAFGRDDLRHHPQIQCRPRREANEPRFEALLR